MPKFAATLASLLLIASSIGVNIARYPQVGRTVDPPQPSDATQSTNPAAANRASAAQSSSLAERANPDSLPASDREFEAAKSPEAGAGDSLGNAQIQQPRDSRLGPGTAPARPQLAAAILDVRPMVPVASLPAARGPADLPAGNDEVRRLPPVQPNVSAIADPQAAGPDEARPYAATSTP